MSFGRGPDMKWCIAAFVLLWVSPSANADGTFLYHTIQEKTGEVVNKSSRTIKMLTSNEIEVIIDWKNNTDNRRGTQTYLLDANYATVLWSVSHPNEDTDYVGERKGNILLIKGELNGNPVDKRIEIDTLPFYNNPSVGLEGFVRAGREKIEFRTIRPDNLSQYKMKAENKGVEIITVSGKKVEVVRVKWGLTGLRSKFYNQTFWFRKSDGVFVKSKPSDGTFSELGDKTHD